MLTQGTSTTMVWLATATLCSTLGGGIVALWFHDRMHYLLSFAAGVLLGVVSFEVIPEIFELAEHHELDAGAAMIAMVVGFLFFHSLEKFILIHRAHEAEYAAHYHPSVGVAAALALIGHSLLDGVAIGLAFQVSAIAGASVALAVIAHDFCDGLNTVGLMLSHGNSRRRSTALLLLDAVAPIIGAASTLLFSVPPYTLMLYLGFFAGFLLYISTSDILPQAHSRSRAVGAVNLIGLTAMGSTFAYVSARMGH
jgi:ZIP family zinc transporter